MSEAAPGPGWWLASDGKWYPPKEADQPPSPGWWLAADGKWYPPNEADRSPGPGWWLASDGKWYAPEERTRSTDPPNDAKPASKGRSRRPARSKAKAPGSRGGRRRAKAETPSAPVEPTPTETTPPPPPSAAPAVAPHAAEVAAAPPLPAGRDRIRPNANEGVSPLDQIERRNQASRADARVLAAKRAEAASRALGGVQSMISAELAARKVDEVFAPPARPAPAPAPASAPAPAPASAKAPSGAARAPEAVEQPTVMPPAIDRSRAERDDASETPEGSPLLEVKSSALSADLEHLGDRLAIFVDRVELRDRLDRVRQSINGDDIVDVVVQKRLTGAVLTIESVRGPGIAAKGLRPEQADEARALIMAKTRPARMAGTVGTHAAKGRPTPASSPAPATNTASPRPASTPPAQPAGPQIDVADLRSKLADLRRVGLLTEDEYTQKLEQLAQLAKGQALTRSTR